MKTKNVLIVGLVIFVIILLISNYQNIYKKVMPPKPEIVSAYADESSTTLFNYSMKVKGEVSNKGGDGYVVVETIVYQDANEWKKTTTLHMTSYQTAHFSLVFDEVKLMGGDAKFSVRTYPLGSTNN